MPTLTSANVAQAIVKLVAAKFLPALVGNLVMGNLVNRDYDATIAQAGDTVNVPLPATLTTNNIAEGGAVVTQNPNLGNSAIVLNMHPEATFQLPDVTRALAQPDLMKLYMQPAINAMAERIESDLLNTYAQFSFNTAIGTGGAATTEAFVDACETALFQAKVPQNEKLNLVVAATPYSTLRSLSRFSEEQTIANPAAIVTGALGKIKNFDVFRSQFVPYVSTTSFNLAFHKNALGLVMRRLPAVLPGTGAIVEYAELGGFGFRIVMSYDANTLSQKFTVDALYGVGVLRNSHAVVLQAN
jgi:P22 coat protein - gene protein 5